MADAHATGPAGTYLYEFAWQSPAFHGRLGGCHGLEIPFVFDTLPADSDPLTQGWYGRPDSGPRGDLVLVNGQLEPTAKVAAGSYERWRVVNACASRFLRLRLEGAELLQVAADVGLLAEPTQMDRVFLGPATGPSCSCGHPRRAATGSSRNRSIGGQPGCPE